MIATTTRQFVRLLPKNPFARSVGVLVGGAVGSQILLILVAPLLTRLYTPEDFGVVAVYGGLLGLIGVVSSLRYELAIPLPEHDVEAAHVAVLSLLLVLAMTILSAVLVFVFGTSIVNVIQVPILARYLWLLPVGVLLVGAYSVFNYWSIRTKRFSTIAKTRVRQALTGILIQVVAFKGGAVALMLAGIVSQSVGTTTLGKLALATPAFRAITWAGLCRAASRYRRFPIFSTWDALLNTAGLQLPPLVLAAIFGPAATGLFSFSHRVLSLPMALIGSAIGQAFFSSAAEAYRFGKLGPLVAQLHAKLAHIGVPPTLLVILVGPDLFARVFGEDWRQAGEFARWMAPWLYLQFVSSPLSTLLAVLECLKEGLVFQIIMVVVRVASIFLGLITGDLGTVVKLFAGTSAICYLGFLFWIGYLAGSPVVSMITPTLSALAIAMLCAAPLGIGLSIDAMWPGAWQYALFVTILLVSVRYWFLLR